MEKFKVEQTENGLSFPDFPNAEKFIRVDHPIANELADLSLYMTDLDFAQSCIERMNTCTDLVTKRALYDCALVYFFKCFGENRARGLRIVADDVFQKNSSSMKFFEHFKNVRNKHVVHDDNALSECVPGAVLNRENAPYKIEKIICSARNADLLDNDHKDYLPALIRETRSYIEGKFNPLCDALTVELEKLSFEELSAKPEIQFSSRAIESADVSKKRRRKA